MRQHTANFANFVCRFGDEKVLIDYVKEIVVPAFTDDKLVRAFGETELFFYEVEIIKLDNSRPVRNVAITGRFIKNTQLVREQIFDQRKGLVHDEAAIATAPSAFFVLLLNTHRLIYFPETAQAPDWKLFRSTALHFMRLKHKNFIDKTYETLKEQGERVPKKALRQMHPEPSLEVVPISGDEQIEQFLKRYGVLKRIQFRIINPNDEIDGAAIFDKIRAFTGPMKPDTTKLDLTNSEGLDIAGAIPRVKQATATANQEVVLSGKDTDGNDLKGDNHEFQVSTEIDPVPPTRKGLVDRLVSTYRNLVAAGVLNVAKQEPHDDRHAVLNEIAE